MGRSLGRAASEGAALGEAALLLQARSPLPLHALLSNSAFGRVHGEGMAELPFPPVERRASLPCAPRELVRRISGLLTPEELSAARLVSHEWHACVSEAVTTLRPRSLGPQMQSFPNLEEIGPPRAAQRWQWHSSDSPSSQDAAAAALSHVSTLTRLRSLTLSLPGSVSSLSPLLGLTQLTALDMARCAVAGADSFSALQALPLRQLNCRECVGLNDDALRHLGGMTALTLLDIGASGVQGHGLTYLSTLSALRVLNLRSLPRLTDVDVVPLSHLEALEQLKLDWCRRLHGTGLGGLTRLRNLKSLSLQQCGVDNTGLLAIAELSSLTQLKLDCNDGISDGGVAALAALASLQDLSVADCPNFRGHGLQELSSLTSLTSLDVSDHSFPNTKRLSAAGFDAIGALASLRCLYVGICGLGDEHVQALRALTSLTLLSAHHSDDLTCAGAKSLARCCPALRHLDLHRCAYLGNEGVAALAGLPGLEHLVLYGCRGVGDAAVEALAAAATALTWLGLNDTGVRSLAPLQALPRLAHVHPSRCMGEAASWQHGAAVYV